MSSFKCDICLSRFTEQFSFFEHLKEHYGLGETGIPETSCGSINTSNISTSTIITSSIGVSDLHSSNINKDLENQSTTHNTICSSSSLSQSSISINPELVLTDHHHGQSSSSSLSIPSSSYQTDSSSFNNESNITTNEEDTVENRIAMLLERINRDVSSKLPTSLVSSCDSSASTSTSATSTSTIINNIIKYEQQQIQNEILLNQNKIQLICPGCSRTFKREKKFNAHISVCCSPNDLTNGIDQNNDENPMNHCTGSINREPEVEDVALFPNGEEFMSSTITDNISTNLMDSEVTSEIIQKINKQVELLANGHICIICDETFTSKGKLEIHLKKLHPEIIRPSMTKKKKLSMQQILSGRKQDVLKCTECDRVFNHRNSLVYHMRSHTGERPHQCESCGKSFFATSALKVHMRLHTGDKPFKCDTCNRHFRQWGDLKYHVISIHSNIRSYQCEFCGKDFARKYSLIVHRRIHTGERNYKCDYCGKSFRAASYLQNHRRIHTGEKPHSCVVCAKPFRVRSDMKRHMASHNREHGQQNHRNSSSNSQLPDSPEETTHVPNIITLNGFAPNQIVTIGSQQLSIREGDTIQVSMLSDGRITVDQAQQLGVGNEAIIADITDETPMISLTTSDGRSRSLDGTVQTSRVQTNELPDGVLYSTRDGTVETVAIRENSSGTLYVWPVFMS